MLTNYWLEHYVEKGHCSLCGNRGLIDTRGLKTLAGVEVGRVNYCVCPNGQEARKHRAPLDVDTPPDQAARRRAWNDKLASEEP